MGEGLSHWSSMVLRKSQTYFFDRHTHPNSMYSNFCHVLKYSMKKSIWDKILKVVIAVASAILGALGANAMNVSI